MVRRTQQQQPKPDRVAEQQQAAGSREFQPADQAQPQAQGQVEGEGSYTASREYQKDIQDYLKKADVQADAKAARPRSEQEAREMEQAEQEGKSHSRGEH